MRVVPHHSVPADETIRQRIRDAARSFVRKEKLIPPQTLKSLKTRAARCLETLGLSESGFDDFTVVMLNNALWEQCFPSIPKDRRLLLLPFCLRNQSQCQAPRDDLGLICNECGACSIPNLSETAEKIGMPVLVAESNSRVAEWVESGEIQAVVGVSCMDSLRSAFPAIFRFAIPGIAVPLTKDGCKDTAFDLSLLEDALAIDDDAPPFAVPYGKISDHLDTLFSVQEVGKYLQEFSSDLRELPREVYHALCSHGKHYRPMIVFGSFCALTNRAEFPEFLNPIALAVECFHKASLIHDDIEDDDATRYDEPTLHQRIGVAAAINVGDYLIGEGYRLLGHPSIPADLKPELLTQTALAHCELSQGQAREFESYRKDVSIEQCLETHRLKTAPAFRVALLMGAVAARKFDVYRDVFYEFADLFGISYQLQDDLEDTQENPSSSVDCLMRTSAVSREEARREIAVLYEAYREKTYDVLEKIDDPVVKILLYRLIGKVLKDVIKTESTLEPQS